MLITKIEQQKFIKKFYNVYIDGKYSFRISDENLVKLKLKVGQELNQTEFDSILNEQQKKEAMDYVFKLLSISPRSKKEIEDKLKLKNFSKNIIEYVINRLYELKYINDTQFAKDWVNYLRNKGKGTELIRIELKHKGIDSETINEVLKESEETLKQEYDRLRNLAEQKLRRMHNLAPKVASRRLLSFLVRRGFSIDAISDVLKELIKKG